MLWMPFTVLVGLLAALPPLAQAPKDNPQPQEAAQNGPGFTATVRPLLKTYCFECHSTNKQKGGLDLEQIETDSTAIDMFELWMQVGERMQAKEMPPSGKKQPTQEERQTILAWVKHVADSRVEYDKMPREQLEKLLAGPTQSRRLSRFEYDNTLRDLFGVNLHAGDLLPSEGGGGEGFDNAAATLFTTPVLLEKYLEAADLVLDTLLSGASKDNPEVANTIDAEQLTAARRKLLIAVPGPQRTASSAARTLLEDFLPRAFRRPVTTKEVERYLEIFEQAAERGNSFEQAVKITLKGVLIAPSFLFLSETPPDVAGVYRLGHYEVASHLSYFLWASMPDAELLELAAQGKLHDPEVLRAQTRRMLRDPRSRSLADGFAAQWLGIRSLGTTVRPDARLFPDFDDALASAMREETALFFDSIVREDRSVLEMIDASYTFVNDRLAAHYEMQGIEGPHMRRVELDNPRRGGVLGQASILTVTSFPHRTSPVLRGRWILDELLGAEVPPPPPDVPVLNERRNKDNAQTLRQMLEKHRSKAECASCHSRMDPLGFGLENFDALGKWRKDNAGGQPIDSAGVLPTGEQFSGPVELKQLLLDKRRPGFLNNLCRKLLGYALAREVRRVDLCVVRDCARALEEGDFRAARLLETIVTSYPFSHRVH